MEEKERSRNHVQRSNRTIQFFWCLVCIIGSVYQGYHITELFLSWELNAEYLNYPQDPIAVPAITACYENAYRNDCPSPNYETIFTGMCREFLDNATVFFDNVVQFEDVFREIAIVAPNGTILRFKSAELIRELFEKIGSRHKLDSWICFQIDFKRLIPESNYTQRLIRSSLAPIIIILHIHAGFDALTQRQNPWFLAEPGEFPAGVSSLVPGPIKDRLTVVAYERRESNLLKPPFKTNCRDYRSEWPYRSQTSCIRGCVVDRSQRDRPWLPLPRGIPYYRRDEQTFEYLNQVGGSA